MVELPGLDELLIDDGKGQMESTGPLVDLQRLLKETDGTRRSPALLHADGVSRQYFLSGPDSATSSLNTTTSNTLNNNSAQGTR